MGKKGTKRKTRWRVLPIGEDGGSGSGNEEEADCDQGACATGSYARATQHRPPIRRQNNGRAPGGGGGYYKHGHPRSYNHHDNSHQPLVTTEKHIFNEEEYTKITTPRQDVLFKKGYLGRKRPPVTTTATESSDQTTSADVINGNAAHYDPTSVHNEGLDNDPTEIVEEAPPHFIYTNGFVDQSGVYYINGSGYEIYDPYSGQVTVVVGPHYGPNGGPPVLAAVPCQPVPLQPLEWFNPPGFLPYVTAPGPPPGLPRDRRKRYSTDSQNCSPHSSESTGPPGSPQESDEVAVTGTAEGGGIYPPPPQHHHQHHHQPPPPPPYVYPGYMFGAPMYNMNGVTVQSAPNAPPSSDVSGKRRKKKRRRRRRRNGAEEGSEESSSEEKDADVDQEEEPMSVTSQESSLESDSKLSGETPRAAPTKSHAHTQTAVEAEQEAVERHQLPPPAPPRDVGTDTGDIPPAAHNGLHPVAEHPQVNGHAEPPRDSRNDDDDDNDEVLHPSAHLTNGRDAKPPKTERRPQPEKKGKNRVLANGLPEKPREVQLPSTKASTTTIEDIADEFAFQDESFLYSQEFVNGNVHVDLDEESEWITVKGHKGSQKRSDPNRLYDDRKLPPELTNGHAKFNKANGVNGACGGKDKLPYNSYNKSNNNNNYNNSDKFSKTDKSVGNVKVEERCTYAKAGRAQHSEAANRVNGRAKLVNGGQRMDGNEKEGATSPTPSEGLGDVPKRSVQEAEEMMTASATPPPGKPSRRERKSQRNNGASPPKTPEVTSTTMTTLTATAKPFEMPSPTSVVSLRPETLPRKGEVASLMPEKMSKEDSLLAALTVSTASREDKTQPEVVRSALTKEGKKTVEGGKKMNGNGGEKKKKVPQSPDATRVDQDLAMKPVEREEVVEEEIVKQVEVKGEVTAVAPAESAKDVSREMIERERRGGDEDVVVVGTRSPSPPVPPPRRKRWHPSSKRLSSDRAPTPGKGESADEASCSSSSSASSSSQESEESVIECLSSGFDSPRGAKVPASATSGFSSDDDDVIYQGTPDQETGDPKGLGRISESLEETSSGNGKTSKSSDVPVKTPTETPTLPPTAEHPTEVVQTVSEEHLENVRKIAQEIVDSILQEAMAESARAKVSPASDPVKLGITDAVTRWLRSQSPDVLSIPRNDDSDTDLSDQDSEEADAERNSDTGPKNLKSNPLPAPSVEKRTDPSIPRESTGVQEGIGRRVAKTSSEKKHHLKDTRNETETPDQDRDREDDDDVISTSSLSCGEWDHWDCHQNFDDDLQNRRPHKHTKNTKQTNIISPGKGASPCTQTTPKYDPLANDTFSPIESTLLEVFDHPMCDPALSVAKYYVLGANPGTPMSPVEDIEASSDDSEANSLTGGVVVGDAEVSLAEELARLQQPLPASWAVDPVRILQGKTATPSEEARARPRHCAGCHCRQHQELGIAATGVVDSGVESGDEGVVTRKRESMSIFKRRLVGRLKGEGAPFPYGGICCILQ